MKALKKEADERLLIEAAQRDPARFAELYELNFERVYAYIVRRVQERAETARLFRRRKRELRQGCRSCNGSKPWKAGNFLL